MFMNNKYFYKEYYYKNIKVIFKWNFPNSYILLDNIFCIYFQDKWILTGNLDWNFKNFYNIYKY